MPYSCKSVSSNCPTCFSLAHYKSQSAYQYVEHTPSIYNSNGPLSRTDQRPSPVTPQIYLSIATVSTSLPICSRPLQSTSLDPAINPPFGHPNHNAPAISYAHPLSYPKLLKAYPIHKNYRPNRNASPPPFPLFCKTTCKHCY